MTGLNHGLTGAVIAIAINQPALAVPLAFVSHFAQDAIPHWDYGVKPGDQFFSRRFNLFLIGDFCLALFAMAFIFGAFPDQYKLIWACMIAAAAPDLMWGYHYLYQQKIKGRQVKLDWLARLHAAIEWSESPPGAIIEFLWIIAFGVLILALR